MIEHTQHLTYLINHARLKQRSLCVSLIELKNAFGEVHHDLIKAVLDYHHIPPAMSAQCVACTMELRSVLLGMDTSQTQYELTEECYQGTVYRLYCSICVSIKIRTIEYKRIKCMGYVAEKTLSPCHWFQFADDTAIVTAL